LPGDPDTAADPVLGFASDGSVLLGSMAMGEPFGREILARPTPLAGGLYLSRWNPGGPGAGRAQLVAPNSWDSVARVRVGVDKPAMALDRGSASRYRNSIYLGWSNLHMVGTPDTLATRGMLATSRDGGRTFTAPRAIADSAFGMAIATGPAGTLDIAYTNMTGREATGHFLHAIRSTDGGQSFGPPVLIARQQGDSVIELPTAAASSDGDVLACWTEGPRGNVRLTRIRCSTRRGEVWAQPIDVGGPDFTGAVAGWPALVATAKGWALLLYLSRTTETEVAVFRTTDGRRFTKLATLARAQELGSGRFCVRVNGVCPPNALKIGHYVSLARSGDRLVAAFILPRPGKYDGSGGVVVSLIDDPSASTLGTR
jgi:hypothetical protein